MKTKTKPYPVFSQCLRDELNEAATRWFGYSTSTEAIPEEVQKTIQELAGSTKVVFFPSIIEMGRKLSNEFTRPGNSSASWSPGRFVSYFDGATLFNDETKTKVAYETIDTVFNQQIQAMFDKASDVIPACVFANISRNNDNRLPISIFDQAKPASIDGQALDTLSNNLFRSALPIWPNGFAGPEQMDLLMATFDTAEQNGVTFEPLQKAILLLYRYASDVFSAGSDGSIYACHRLKNVKTENNLLHCSDGPACEDHLGQPYYFLVGIMVKPEYVLTPPDKLSPETILAETNAEIRVRLIRRTGIKNIIHRLQGYRKLDEDKENKYVLVGCNLPAPRPVFAVYLQMVNPSTGETHLEGVPPEIRTVAEAIAWRSGKKEWHPSELT